MKPADPKRLLRRPDKEIRLDPEQRDYALYEQGRALTLLGRWQQAIAALSGSTAHHPDELWPHVDLAVDYIEAGQDSAAHGEVAKILRINPKFSLKTALQGEFPTQQQRADDLRKAGLK